MSTGVILLADVLPAICVKLIAPFVVISMNIKVIIVVVMSSLSFIIVSVSSSNMVTILGVICASISSGLGEASFLSFTHYFSECVIGAWSSGTGASGVIGAGSYAVLTSMGLSPHNTVLLMLIIPVGLAITFFCVVTPTKTYTTSHQYAPISGDELNTEADEMNEQNIHQETDLFLNKIILIRGLLKYMVPLGAVYYFEYLINQGLFELLYFPGTVLSHRQQYRVYQVLYQVGVLVSRSSLSCLVINKIYILSTLQGINLVILLLQSIYWTLGGNSGLIVILCFIFWEGLLGGAAYVNSFHKISNESSERDREFSLGISSIADSIAIGLAGLSALPLHNWICDVPISF